MTFATSKFYKFLSAATMTMVMQFMVSMSDAIICGNIVGETGLGAINLMQGFFEINAFVSLLIVIGACVHFSTESGAFHLRRAKGYFTLGLMASVVIGIAGMIIFAIARVPVLKSLGASSEIYEAAAGYCLWYLPYVALMPVFRFLLMMCAADGNMRLSTGACVVQLVVNLSVSSLCTYIFGVKGCAIGTWAGAVFGILCLMFHFRRKSCTLGFCMHFGVTDVFRMIKTSLGYAGRSMAKAFLFFILNAFVIAKFGSESLPVFAAVVMVFGMSVVFDGIGNAVQPLVGVYVGEKNTLLVRRIMGTAVKVALCGGGGMALLLAIFPQLILKLTGISNPEIIPQAEIAVRIVSWGLVGYSLVMLFDSYYAFTDHDALSAVLAILAMCGCPLALAIPTGLMFGMNGMWVALAIAPIAAIAIVAVCLVWKYGMSKFPLLLEREREKALHVFDFALNPDEICAKSREVETHLLSHGIAGDRASRAALLVEETFMSVRDRNAGKKVLGEITVDFNNKHVELVLCDDGEIFNLTDADAKVLSLRIYLVSNLMLKFPHRHNLATTGFNRNTFRL